MATAELRHDPPTSARLPTIASVSILGQRVDCLGLEETASRCRDAVLRRERVHHVSLNAAKLVAARDDGRLARILHSAHLASADGQSVVWASRLLGNPLPERVAGIDLMLRLLEIAEHEGFGVFFLGARADVLERALERLRLRHPGLRIVGSQHGYFDDADSARICDAVDAAGSDVLFVAMSSPRKEYWVAEHERLLEVPLIVGVGGALDVIAGDVARAPVWAQRTGLEWAFRLAQEPRRLWRRYLTTNVRFLVLVAGALARRRRGREQ